MKMRQIHFTSRCQMMIFDHQLLVVHRRVDHGLLARISAASGRRGQL
jgi:hypothetical protein